MHTEMCFLVPFHIAKLYKQKYNEDVENEDVNETLSQELLNSFPGKHGWSRFLKNGLGSSGPGPIKNPNQPSSKVPNERSAQELSFGTLLES